MSFYEIESSALDAEEARDSEHLQLSVVSGGHAFLDQRRQVESSSLELTHAEIEAHVQAHIQAQVLEHSNRPIHFANYGHINVTVFNDPVQNIYDLATGHLAGAIDMGKLVLSVPFIGRWEILRRRRANAKRPRYLDAQADDNGLTLTKKSQLASPSSSRQRPQAMVNGERPEQELMNTSPLPSMLPTTEEAAPDEYMGHSALWYQPGRCFSIWAPDDVGIHKGKFVLLDTQNSEGRAVFVRTLDNEGIRSIVDSSSSYRNKVVLKGSGSQGSHSTSLSRAGRSTVPRSEIVDQDQELLLELKKKRLLEVQMDEHAQTDVHPGTIISLNLVRNISFVKYKCVDHGMLDGESLEDLRWHYIQYLINNWRLTRRARESYGGSKS